MTTVLTEPANLGLTKLEGQVVVLDIDVMNIGAPTKAKPYFKVNINAALPPEGCPSGSDVSWLVQKATFYVVAVLPEGTININGLTERGVAP